MSSISGIDVVIVNYNSGDELSNCLSTLTTNEDISITVVDNGSNDGSIDNIKAQFNHINLIQNDHNIGFSKACNQGASTTSAPHIAFINPDCYIRYDQLKRLSNQLNQHPHAALIGCRVLNQDGSLQAASRRQLPTFFRVLFHLTGLSHLPWINGINLKDQGQFNELKTVTAINGSCMLIKRNDFESIGGFDEAYPLHFEDLDLFARLLKAGKQIVYDSEVEVIHLQGQSDQNSEKVKHWKKQGLQRFFEQHRPNWEAKIVNLLLRLK